MELLERSRVAHFRIAVVLCAVSAVTAATTFLPGAPYVPRWVVMTSFVLIFPVFGAAVLRDAVVPMRAQRADGGAGGRADPRAEMSRLFAAMPAPGRAAAIALVVAMWLAGLSGIVGTTAGQPQEIDGRYVLNNRGEMSEVSREEHDRAVATSTRAFAAAPATFFALAAILSRYGPLSTEAETGATRPA